MEELKVYVISDSLGETAEAVLKASISQFKTENYEINRFSRIKDITQLEKIMKEAAYEENVIVVFTLVSDKLIRFLNYFAKVCDITAIDLMSPLIAALSDKLNNEPSRKSGAIRELDEAYFSRVAAIEFAVRYDDGKDPRGFLDADLVLLGVSRTSKTPLSMYLANKGIKVANLPLVVESEPPKEIYEVSSKRIIGLTNSPEKLNEIREQRLKSLGLPKNSNYANFSRILDELEYADKIMRKIGCPIIDVSNKAIEETADIVASLMVKSGINIDWYLGGIDYEQICI